MRNDEDYELEIDLCIVYGNENDPPLNDKLEDILEEASFQIELEGIYGEAGNHVFQVYEAGTINYLGAFSGVYDCND